MTSVSDPSPPRLSDGVEVLGEYAGSGYKQPHYMVRRADGQVIQLTHLLYLVADAVDGRRDAVAIAEWVSDQAEREISAEQVDQLLTDKLGPLGLLGDG